MVRFRKTEIDLRNFFQNILFWVVLMYFVQGVVVGVLFKENGRTTKALIRTGNLEQENKLKIEATAQATYITCLNSIPLITRINHFAGALYDEHKTLVKNSQAVINVTPKDDPQRETKIKNLEKLANDGPAIKAVHFKVQTKADCKAAKDKALAQIKPSKLSSGARVKSS